MRTGAASGKNRASPATALVVDAMRPVAVACCAKRMKHPLPRLALPDLQRISFHSQLGMMAAKLRRRENEQRGSQFCERKD